MDEQLISFFNYLKYQKRYSEHTLSSYENDLNGYLHFQSITFNKGSLLETESTMVRSWVVHLSKEGFEPRSINRKISTLNSYFKYLIRNNLIVVNPMKHINLLKISKRLPSFFTEDDMQSSKLILESNLTDYEILRNKLIVNILYNTGCRKAELIALKQIDINYNRSEITVMGKGKKERNIPISAELVDDIKKFVEVKHDFFKDQIVLAPNLFLSSKGKEMQPKAIYNIVKDQLHLPSTSDKKSPHVLRHTFATHM
nr:tyrosine-type recombinase/integrase [Saprospiraceae bacterium]